MVIIKGRFRSFGYVELDDWGQAVQTMKVLELSGGGDIHGRLGSKTSSWT